MHSDQIVPIVTTDRLAALRQFYVDLLGLQVSFDNARYLGVRAGAKGSPEIGFMHPDADCPDSFGGKGLTLAIQVANADRECARLRDAGATIAMPLTDMPWGARTFMVQDPIGISVFISHPIPAAVEYQACMK
jgi:predicted enzyme related to lactoylglutathione lyase